MTDEHTMEELIEEELERAKREKIGIQGDSPRDKKAARWQAKERVKMRLRKQGVGRAGAEHKALLALDGFLSKIMAVALIVGLVVAFGIWGLTIILLFMAIGASNGAKGE